MRASTRDSYNPHELTLFLIVIVDLIPEVSSDTDDALLRPVSVLFGV